MTPTTQTDDSLRDFLHTTLASMVDSGKQADSKAATLLGFTGIFLNISLGSLLALNGPGKLPLLAFVPMIVFYSAGVLFAILALWSRNIFRNRERGISFFGNIANYHNANEFKRDIETRLYSDAYSDELAQSSFSVARLTRRKHQYVDLAAIFSGLGLGCFILLASVLLTR